MKLVSLYIVLLKVSDLSMVVRTYCIIYSKCFFLLNACVSHIFFNILNHTIIKDYFFCLVIFNTYNLFLLHLLCLHAFPGYRISFSIPLSQLIPSSLFCLFPVFNTLWHTIYFLFLRKKILILSLNKFVFFFKQWNVSSPRIGIFVTLHHFIPRYGTWHYVSVNVCLMNESALLRTPDCN